MKIISLADMPYDEVVSAAVGALKEGKIVIYPTETMYGVGVDATNQGAVDRVLQYKSRREGKPLSIAVSGIEMAEQYVEVNSTAHNLYTHFLPGPLTVVSRSLGKVAFGVASESGTLGVRIPDYPLVLEIVNALGRPITATSANASYHKRPYAIADILDNLSEKQKSLIDLIIDAGELPKREPSTVVDTTLEQEVVLRQGNLKLTDVLERHTNSVEETQELGAELMKKYYQYVGYKSVIFALQGELGAGKTQLTKGIARVLGISGEIQSPTFIIEREYKVVGVTESYVEQRGVNLYHLDTWRLESSEELVQMGFVEKVAAGNVFVVEWADRVQDVLERVSEDAVIVWVQIAYGVGLNERLIRVSDYA